MNKFIELGNLPDLIDTAGIVRLSKGKVTMRVIDYAMRKYEKDKRVIRIKRGIYSKSANPFFVAARLYGGYIGLSSALYLYRLKPEVESSIFVCVDKPMKAMRFLDKTLTPVNLSKDAYGTALLDVSGLSVLVSTFPKTLFDMLARPRHANYFDFYRAINSSGLKADKWNELLYYLKRSNLTVVRRCGHALDGVAPGRFTRELQKISDNGEGSSFFFRHRALNYDSTWKIFDELAIRRWKDAS